MLRIAVCDDMPDELQRIAAATSQYLSAKRLDADLMTFTHPDRLLQAMESGRFHLYILDVVMPMVDGLALGREIRRLDREAQIIYATTEPQFALQAYAASPINYLIKPIDSMQLFDTLDLAVAKAETSEEQTFVVKTAGSLRVLRLSELVCCEYRSHAVTLCLANGETVLSRTMRERFSAYCAPILKDRHFLQCHSAFIINMRRVQCFAKDHFVLLGDKIVPIAARQYPAVRDAYMDYLMAKGD